MQDLVLQRAICILGHTHDQKIYYTSMSEPCADYLGEHNIHYIITRDIFFFFTLSLRADISNQFIEIGISSIFGPGYEQPDIFVGEDFC